MRTKNRKILTFFLVIFLFSVFLICLNSILETQKICFAWYECDENGFCYETPSATPMMPSSFYHGFSYSATSLLPQESINIWQFSPMLLSGDVGYLGYYDTGLVGVSGMGNSNYSPTTRLSTLFDSQFPSPGVPVRDITSTGYELTTYPSVTMFTITGFPVPDIPLATEYERIYPPWMFTNQASWEDLYPVNNYLWWL